MRYPKFTTGIGKLSAAVLNKLFGDVETLPGLVADIDVLKQQRKEPGVYEKFWAQITNRVAIGGESWTWDYEWEEVIMDDSPTPPVWITKPDGMTSTATTYARCITEGITGNASVADDTYVHMWIIRGDDGTLRYVFGTTGALASSPNAKITVVSGGANSTYSAELLDNPDVNVSSATPIDRIVASGIDWAAKSVDDACLLVPDAAGDLELVAWEKATADDCDDTSIAAPGSSTDNAIVRFDGVSGAVGQDSGVIIDDSDIITIPGGIIADGAVVLNEAGAAVDTRIEGDTEVNLLFVDASADSIGIGNNAPSEVLDVTGNIKGVSLIISGTSFPASPVDGQMIRRTDLDNELFYYDDTRSLWLGELVLAYFSTAVSPWLINIYLKNAGTAPGGAWQGIPMNDDMRIIGLDYYSNTINAVSMDILLIRANTTLATIDASSATNRFSDRTLNVAFSGGNELAIRRGAAGSNPAIPFVTLRLRRDGGA